MGTTSIIPQHMSEALLNAYAQEANDLLRNAVASTPIAQASSPTLSEPLERLRLQTISNQMSAMARNSRSQPQLSTPGIQPLSPLQRRIQELQDAKIDIAKARSIIDLSVDNGSKKKKKDTDSSTPEPNVSITTPLAPARVQALTHSPAPLRSRL